MPPMRKVCVSSTTRCLDLTLAHCSPSSTWVPNGNTGEIKAARKGTGHPNSHADGSGLVSSLTGTPLRTKVHRTTFTLLQPKVCCVSLQSEVCYFSFQSEVCYFSLQSEVWYFSLQSEVCYFSSSI